MIRAFAVVFPCLLLAGCFSQQPAPAVDRSSTVQSRASALPQPSGPGYYTVKRGDTLIRIAFEYGQDYKDIAAWNGLANPSAIKEGQVLRVVPPVSGESAGVAVTKPIVSEAVVEARSLDQHPVSGQQPATDGLKREPRVGKEPYSDEAHARLNKTGEALKPVEAKLEPKKEPLAESSATSVAVETNGIAWEWPHRGKVTRSFGEPANKGVDLAGKLGDQVSAAADGKVIYVGEALPGYGKLIIIKHGDEYNSVYAHNSKFIAKEHDLVKRGQKIAEMGSSGADSVKLHFEIRRQGKAVDPAQFLPKR